MEKTFKDTLNLPHTDMPMKAGLINIESSILESWEKNDIYKKRLEENKNNNSFILHDGPPYPNGNIHLGHALNKILKDIVVKYHLMKGDYTPFIPGWDCHGLPIETQMLKELKKDKSYLSDRKEAGGEVVFRNQCKEYALRYVDMQKEQFRKMGVFGDFDNPYLTLTPEYERGVIELFGKMAEKGVIYQGRKPIHWCMNCTTALAEAEIEYADEKSPSIYVKFTLEKEIDGHKDVSLIVWTTTPWTLPANVAVAVSPVFEYVLFEAKGEKFICVEELLPKIQEVMEWDSVKILTHYKGEQLVGLKYSHPFINEIFPIISADFVSNEDGSGLVHIAPGHGHEDYIAGLKFNLPVVMPVDDKGVFTEEAGKYQGMKVFDANKEIVQDMEASGKLLKMQWVKHSYPHCWRCQSSVIFRATEQWFVRMDGDYGLRGKALKKIAEINKNNGWIPGWGEKRIRGMVEGRPDWCISRQRSWGIPIPVFYCEKCNEPHYTGIFNQAVAEMVGKEGTNAWFTKTAEQILPKGTNCTKCGNQTFYKDTNIMDVWLESGASHEAVIRTREELSYPADLYLEGSDQHRGWFQSSLLTSVAAYDKAPYKQVLTHGFTIDEKGQKMSKSKGNVIDPLKVVGIHGVDILRLWVSSTDFRNDVALSENIISQIKDAFSKIRNTLRFMISNFYDFDPSKDALEEKDLLPLDKYIVAEFKGVICEADKAYDTYFFHQIYRKIYEFCVGQLSSFYLDIQKDNLYCNATNSKQRRSAQTAMYLMSLDMVKILAPILSFSMEDIYKYLPIANKKESVLLEMIPNGIAGPELLDKDVQKIRDMIAGGVRPLINIELEKARKDKVIGSSLDAKVVLYTAKDITAKDIMEIMVLSQVEVKKIKGDDKVEVFSAEGDKCERCWKYATLSNNGLCPRCEEVVNG
ncbi:MAG: isoleucine--tRNA ligase [Candidatus Margulisbacteria bacterium]|nr:isoleucine--tRNA ligase [Candidatus Margulisiibacteriota bacterium]